MSYRIATTIGRLTLLLLSLATSSWATDYDTSQFRIPLPDGFQGPIKQNLQQNAQTMAFVKIVPDSTTPVLLQISTYDFGNTNPPIPATHLGRAADRYLQQMLADIQRRRTSYSESPPSRVQLSGLPAAKASWTGILDNQKVAGFMYCVVSGSTVIVLNTQASQALPATYLNEATRAIEQLQLKSAHTQQQPSLPPTATKQP